LKTLDAQRLQVVECLPLVESIAGFALPLLAHPHSANARLIQEVDELTDVVARFVTLQNYNFEGVSLSGQPQVYAVLGQPMIYAFFTEDAVAHVGTLDELAATLEAFVHRKPRGDAVALQIIELMGHLDQKKLARTTFRNEIRNSVGLKAAQAFYEGSILRSSLWQRLLSRAPSTDFAQRILGVRSQLSAEIVDGKIQLDLRALEEEDRAQIDQDRLEAELLEEFVGLGMEAGAAEIVIDTGSVEDKRADELVRVITRTGRQEERVAIILREILRDRENGLAILSKYQLETAKFAKRVLREIEFSFKNRSSKKMTDEALVASMVRPMFMMQFPMSRGALLYYLAKHLGNWPLVADEIRERLGSTESQFVVPYRHEIDSMLYSYANS
jgi:hypothetical protein